MGEREDRTQGSIACQEPFTKSRCSNLKQGFGRVGGRREYSEELQDLLSGGHGNPEDNR